MGNRASMEEALTRTVDSMGGQTEKMSIRMGEIENAVTVERETCGNKLTTTDKNPAEAKNV